MSQIFNSQKIVSFLSVFLERLLLFGDEIANKIILFVFPMIQMCIIT
jgi:hypothetical protein